MPLLRESAPGLQVSVEIHEWEVRTAELEHPNVKLVHDGRWRRIWSRRQWPHTQVAVGDLALRVVALQREGPAAEPVQLGRALRQRRRRLGPVDDERVVDADLDARLAHGHAEREPLVVRRERPVNVADAVEAPRHLELEVVAVLLLRVVDLNLEALRRPVLLLERRVEIEAGVGAGAGLHLGHGLEVLEGRLAVRADIEEVGARSVARDGAVHHPERSHVLGSSPAREARPVEERDVALLGRAHVGSAHGQGQREKHDRGVRATQRRAVHGAGLSGAGARPFISAATPTTSPVMAKSTARMFGSLWRSC
jgi:hypothetical protein